MSLDFGIVANVTVSVLGDELAADVASGATSLTVVDAADFSEDGGTLTIGTQTVTYTAADDETGVLTLGAPLTSAYLTGERVLRYPVAQDKTAMVTIGGTDDPVEARIPQALWDRIPEGIRTDGEMVSLDYLDGEFVVADVLGPRPRVDGSYIDPTTLPPTPSDGLPPPSSPTPTVTGLQRAVHLRWSGVVNADPVTYEVHAAPAGTTPATTKVSETVGTQAVVTTLADGSPLAYPPASYDFWLVARDEDGAAAASARVPGAPNQAAAGDLAASSVTAVNLAAVIVLASRIASADTGRRWEADADGIRVYASDGTTLATFPTNGDPITLTAEVVATYLTAVTGASLRGQSEVARSASLWLRSGTTGPGNPPNVMVDWESIQVDTVTPASGTGGTFPLDPTQCWGLARDGSRWLTMQSRSTGDARLWAIDPATGATTYVRDFGSAWPPSRATSVAGVGYDMLVASDRVHLNQTGAANVLYAIPRLNASQVPALGTDGTNLLLAESRPSDGRVVVRTISASDRQTVLSTVTSSADLAPNYALAGVAQSAFDFGGQRIIVAGLGANGSQMLPMLTTGIYQAGEQFRKATNDLRGFAWDGSAFWALSGDGRLYKHTDAAKTETVLTWQAAHTWYDANPTGGTHETPMSPVKTFTMRRRARVTVAAASPIPVGAAGPDDPDSIQVYLGRASTARTDLWRQTSPPVGATSAVVTAPVFTGTNPPASNDFPTSQPGAIESASGGFVVRGDGTGAWPALTRPEWSCMVRRATTLTLTTGTETLVAFDSEDEDASNIHSGGVFTVPAGAGGVWRFTAYGSMASSATGRRVFRLNRSSTTPATNSLVFLTWPAPATGVFGGAVPWEGRLAAGDALRLWARQDSGADLALPASGDAAWATFEWVRP